MKLLNSTDCKIVSAGNHYQQDIYQLNKSIDELSEAEKTASTVSMTLFLLSPFVVGYGQGFGLAYGAILGGMATSAYFTSIVKKFAIDTRNTLQQR